MRSFSMLLNIIMLIMMAVILVDDGWPRKIEEQFIFCVLLVTPVFSLITLWGLRPNRPKLWRSLFSESWLALFIQRKKLEEKEKLEKLKSNEH